MHHQRLTISQRQVNPDWLILDFHGPITSPFDRNWISSTNDLRATPITKIAFNLTDVSDMDGAGLKQLLILCVTLRKLNRKLTVFGLNEEIQNIFQLTRMDAILQIFQDEYQMLHQGVT